MNRIQTRIPVEYEWVLVPALCGDCGVLSGTNKPENCKAAKKKSKGPKELSKYWNLIFMTALMELHL